MSQLETNTTKIQSIIDKLAGKAAGGGGSGAEACTVTIEIDKMVDPMVAMSGVTVYYIDGNMMYQSVQSKGQTITTVKNGLFVIQSPSSATDITTTNITTITSYGNILYVFLTENDNATLAIK